MLSQSRTSAERIPVFSTKRLKRGNMPALSIGNCIRFGWETFKKRPGILIGAFLLVVLVPAIPSALFPGPHAVPNAPPPPPTAPELIASLASFVISIFASLGAITFSLRAHDDIAATTLADLWNPQAFWRFLGNWILFVLAVFVGLLLFIVPGVIAAIGLCFAPYLVVDRARGPVEALKESWDLTKGHKWQLFLLGLALVGLNLLGMLALVVGLLVSGPVSWLAMTHAYRTLQSRA
jgi:hypothetical protein